MESRLTAVVTAKGAEQATKLLDKFATSADGADKSVDELAGGVNKTAKEMPRLASDTKKATDKINKFGKAANDSGRKVKGASSDIKGLGASAAQAIAAIDGPLGGVSSRISSLTSLLKGGAGAFGLIAAGAVGFGAVLAVGAKNLDEYDVNLRRVSATIKATGEGVGFTAIELQKQAEVLAIATLTSVEEVQKAQAKLITFNRVLGSEFQRTVAAAQDLAEAGFGTIESNVITLGKALQDPATGMASLTRVGITLSEQQKELAKDALAVGDVFAAQEVILKAVEGQVKGVAEAVADGTLAGIADSAGIAWDRFTRNLAENRGALEAWKATVSAAGSVLNVLADGLENASASDSFAESLEVATELAEAERELLKIQESYNSGTFESGIDRATLSFERQAIKVELLRSKLAGLQEDTAAAAKSQNDEIRATARAREKEAEARVRTNKEAAESAKKQLDDDKKKASEKQAIIDKREQADKDRVAKALQRDSGAASARVVALQAANDTELESIKRQSEAKFQQAALDAENGLIQYDEFLLAKAEIKKKRDADIESLAKKQKDKDDKDNKKRADADKKLRDETLSSLSSNLKKGTALQKAAAVAEKAIAIQQATEKTYSSANNAYEVGSRTSPFLGAAYAALAVTAGVANVAKIASAREQGGQTFSGQTILAGERGAELITTESNARVINAKDTANIMNGGNGGNVVNLTVIDQSTGNKEFTQETTNGETILLIRDIVSSDFQNPNSQITRGAVSGLDTSVRRI